VVFGDIPFRSPDFSKGVLADSSWIVRAIVCVELGRLLVDESVIRFINQRLHANATVFLQFHQGNRWGDRSARIMQGFMRFIYLGLILCWGTWGNRADSVIAPSSGRVGFASNLTLGFSFGVGPRPVWVTSLGIFDYSSDGLEEAHSIGLWDLSGGLLASVSIAAGTSDALDGGFRYIDLSSTITLNAGQTYVLGATFGSGKDLAAVAAPPDIPAAGYSPLVVGGDVRRHSGPEFSFPELATSLGAIMGPNARIAVVPEPSTTVLAIAGLVLPLSLKLRSFFFGRRHGRSP
jgi:hypothetical protein